MTEVINNNRDEAINYYKTVKEEVLYGFPLKWGNIATTIRTKKGHCGAKAELLAHKLGLHKYKYRYVVGYNVGMFYKPIMPKFLDLHFWIEVLLNDEWLTLDPSPDSVAAGILGDTIPGTHLGTPSYTRVLDGIPPWYKDVYNNWSILPYKIIINLILMVERWKAKRINGKKSRR